MGGASMFTGNIFSYAQNEASGASFTLFNLSFPGSPSANAEKPTDLIIPWRELQEETGENPLALLEWQSRCSSFAGRKTELQRLRKWADSKPMVSVKFVCGHGGVGKSRLAAEFADSLDTEGWRAGFVNLRQSAAYKGGPVGTLMVIDYPEENRDVVVALLRDLAKAGIKCRLRLLLLTRSTIKEWEGIISDARSRGIVDWEPVQLVTLPLDDGAAYTIYSSTLENVAENKETTPLPLATADLKDWMKRKGEHALPLFLVAAAVYSALHPDEEEVRFTGPEVMTALVEREGTRLRGMAEGLGLPLDSLPLALTYATLCKGVPLEELEDDADLRRLLGLEGNADWQDVLTKSGHAQDGNLRNLEPDIVGADFVHATLGRNKKTAPELVWRAAARNPEAAIGTFGRLIYDAQMTLGRAKPHVHDWLLDALEADNTRCASLKPWTQSMRLPTILAACSVFVSKHILTDQTDDAIRALRLNNMSVDLVAIGKQREALEAIEKAMAIYRRLAEQEPDAYAPYLAGSLNNMAPILSALGRHPEALVVSEEASGIYRRLAAHEPEAYDPDLAMLNTLSVRLSNQRRHQEALAAIEEAVTIYRRLAAQEPTAYTPDLAMSLNNMSNHLSDLGRHQEALKAIEDAVVILRRLAAQEPAAYEPDLAGNLNNMSIFLSDLGRHQEALAASVESVAIRRRLNEQEPAAYAPLLASSLNNMSGELSALGQHQEALTASDEAVRIYMRFAAHNFLGMGRNLAVCLRVLGKCYTALDRHEEAAAAKAESEDVERRLKEAQGA